MDMLGLRKKSGWDYSQEETILGSNHNNDDNNNKSDFVPREQCTVMLEGFLKRCLDVDPDKRWKAAKLLEEDEWLNCPIASLDVVWPR